MVPVDFKKAISEDIAEIDLVLAVLSSLRNTNLTRLALIQESEARSGNNSGISNKEV